MRRNLTILLVEDELQDCQSIENYVLTKKEEVTLIGITNNANEALNIIIEQSPDVLILDLELHQGFGNGLDLLNDLSSLQSDYAPFTLVTTNNNSKIVYRQARFLGADFIMSKFQDDYGAHSVIDFLISMKRSIHNNSKSKIININSYNTLKNPEKHLEKIIINNLDAIGISPKVLGRKYLAKAIQLIINDCSAKICSALAIEFHKSDASIERAMQNAINQAWRISNIDDLNNLYTARIHSEKGVPTYTEFIYYFADKIKLDY